MERGSRSTLSRLAGYTAGSRRRSVGSAREAPNLLRYVFMHPRAQEFLLEWEDRARHLVAEFRADTPAMRDDPRRAALIDELCAASQSFRRAGAHNECSRAMAGRRSFRAGNGAVRHFEQHILRIVRRTDLRMTVLVPVK